MRLVSLSAAVATSMCAFLFAPVAFAQATDLKPAMARILALNGQGGGSGFVFRYDDKDHVAYWLTNEHVLHGSDKVNVQFFAGRGKAVQGAVTSKDKGKDLAVVKVSGVGNIPDDVMILAFGHATTLMQGDSV